MKNAKHLGIGSMLLISLLMTFSGCAHAFARKAPEPKVEWCVLQGDGFAICVTKDGQDIDRPPSDLKDYIAMPLDDATTYRKFCNRRREGK